VRAWLGQVSVGAARLTKPGRLLRERLRAELATLDAEEVKESSKKAIGQVASLLSKAKQDEGFRSATSGETRTRHGSTPQRQRCALRSALCALRSVCRLVCEGSPRGGWYGCGWR
jgi:hypothetical protein